MSRRLVVALGALALAGCGSGDGDQKPAAARPPAVPAELQGTYNVHFEPGDLPAAKSAPDELKPENKPYSWRVEITDTGGPGNGPALTIVHPTLGALESPKLRVSGDRLRLLQEECAGGGGYEFTDTTYGWTLSGDKLRLTKLAGGCDDKVAETILTTKPLTKVP